MQLVECGGLTEETRIVLCDADGIDSLLLHHHFCLFEDTDTDTPSPGCYVPPPDVQIREGVFVKVTDESKTLKRLALVGLHRYAGCRSGVVNRIKRRVFPCFVRRPKFFTLNDAQPDIRESDVLVRGRVGSAAKINGNYVRGTRDTKKANFYVKNPPDRLYLHYHPEKERWLISRKVGSSTAIAACSKHVSSPIECRGEWKVRPQ